MAQRVRYVDDERITVLELLRRTHDQVEAVVARALTTQVGIGTSVHDVLLRLARAPGHRLRVTELAAQLRLTTGGATRLVNRVVQLGFATKQPCPVDRRVQWVQLTPLGRRVVERATRLVLAELQDELFDRISDHERLVLQGLCARLLPTPTPQPHP